MMIILCCLFIPTHCKLPEINPIKAPRPTENQVIIDQPLVEDCTCNVLTVEERAYFLDDVTIEGSLSIAEKIKVDDLTVHHNTIIKNDLEVGDDLFVGDSATILNDLTIEGSIDTPSISVCDVSVDCSFVTGPTATASIAADLTIGDDLTVIDDATISGNVTADGNITVSGDLTVDGSIEVPSISVCDLSVDCNLFMVDSDGTDGTIFKDSARFIHNSGIENTFVGKNSGVFTPFGQRNTAVGENALISLSSSGSSTLGWNNTAIGSNALFSNTTGFANVAIGRQALENCTTGAGNIAIGTVAGTTVTTGINNIHIGHIGVSGDNNIIRIGMNQTTTFLVGNVITTGTINSLTSNNITANINISTDTLDTVGPVTVPDLQNHTDGDEPVYVNTSLGYRIAQAQGSAKKFKENIFYLADVIKKDESFVERILQLNPVRFSYKHDLQHKVRFGLIADEVEDIIPELVKYKNGELYSVQYQDLHALILLVCKYLYLKVKKLETMISELQEEHNS